MRKLQIAVIGSAGPEEYEFKKPMQTMYKAAEELGYLLAMASAVVVNGGKGGVMEAVCKGAKRGGGLTVAEVAGSERGSANKYVDIEVVTYDAGFRGPSQLIGMSDAVISLGGGSGTLQEICVAYRMCKPTILLTGYGGWTDMLAKQEFLDERQLQPFITATAASKAVESAINQIKCKIRSK